MFKLEVFWITNLTYVIFMFYGYNMEYTVNSILEQLRKSEQYRDKYLKSRATRNINWYNGKYDNASPLNIDLSVIDYYVNLAYSTTRTIVSSIYNRFPEFSFFLSGDISKSIKESYGLDIQFQTEKLSRVLELITKTYFKEMQARRTNRIAITDAILCGYGVTKMGYNTSFDSGTYKLLKQSWNMPKDKFIELASSIEVSDLVKSSNPYLLRIHPLNMLFPVDADMFNRIAWQAEILYKDKDEVEEAYGVKGKLKAGYVDTYMEKELLRNQKPDKVKIYEYHSLDPKFPYICVLADGYDKFLDKKPHPLYDEKNGVIKNMYQYIWFNEPYESIYPLSDIDLVASEIREANEQIRKRIEHVRKFVRMYFLKGVFDEDEKLKLVTGADGTYIQSLDGNADCQPIPNADLSVDFYNNINAIRNEIYETLGLTDYSIGSNTQNRKATEAQLIEIGRKDRVQERVDIIEEFCYSQVDTFVEVMKEYQQLPRMFNIELQDEKISFLFAGELLKMSDIQTQVVPGSTISLDRDAEIRRMERLSVVLANANAGQPGMIKFGKFFKDWLSRMGFNGSEYINEDNIQMPVPGNGSQVPALPGLQQAPGEPTNTPMANAAMPQNMGQMLGGMM